MKLVGWRQSPVDSDGSIIGVCLQRATCLLPIKVLSTA